MSNPETVLLQQIRLALAQIPGVIVWRNSIGHDSRAHVDYGIQNPGGSDLIGWCPPSGRFLAIEVKTDTGVVSDAQRNFISMVRHHGGLAGIARSVADAIRITHGHILD